MIKNKEKWTYLLIGTGCGIILSGILMVAVSLVTGETLWEYKRTSEETIQKLQIQVDTYENISAEEPKVNVEKEQQKEDTDVNKEDSEINEEGTYIWVTIPHDYGSTQIAKLLEKEGIVDNHENFHEYIKAQKKTTKLRTGDKYLPIKGEYKAILDILLGKNN